MKAKSAVVFAPYIGLLGFVIFFFLRSSEVDSLIVWIVACAAAFFLALIMGRSDLDTVGRIFCTFFLVVPVWGFFLFAEPGQLMLNLPGLIALLIFAPAGMLIGRWLYSRKARTVPETPGEPDVEKGT